MHEQLDGVNVHYVSTIEDVLNIALPSDVHEERQDEKTREEVLTT
jgi:ATP-dependent Lon protease